MTTRMTEERLAEIREEARGFTEGTDVDLLAEVDALRAELKRLQPPHLTDVEVTLGKNLRKALARADRLEKALREIARGKTQADNENPQGDGLSMAGRFIGLARAALGEK